jgi:hypothetical protein
MYGGVEEYSHAFLILGVVGGERLALISSSFVSVDRAVSTLLMEAWMKTRAGLDDVEERKFKT